MPLELVARLSADEGYLGVMEILSRHDVERGTAPSGDATARAHEAQVLAGGSAAAQPGDFRFARPS